MSGRGRRRALRLTLAYGALLALLAWMWLPVVWVALSSLKTLPEALAMPPQLVFRPVLDAYARMLGDVEVYRAIRNSLVVSAVSVVVALALGVPGAYALARFPGRVQRLLGLGIISTRVLPRYTIALPFYIAAITVGMFDTITLLVVVYLAMNLPFTVWLLKGAIEQVPREMDEAAMLDGCSRLRVLVQIVGPLVLPMMVAVSILNYIFTWNEFMYAFLLTSRRARTLPVMIPALAGTMDLDWPLMSALSVASMIPPLVLVAFVQRYLVRGLMTGSVQ